MLKQLNNNYGVECNYTFLPDLVFLHFTVFSSEE